MNNIFSIVLPVRIDCEERLENLKAVLNWINNIGCSVVLLEADKKSQLHDLQAEYKQMKYIFIEDSSSVFHRTKYINYLLNYVNTKIVAIWDADIIIPLAQVEHTIKMMLDKDIILAYPYSGTFYMLPEDLSKMFRQDLNINNILCKTLPPLMGRRSCGGVYFVNRIEYISIGGENEKYKGWGPEDAERLRRTLIIGKKAEWLNYGKAFHLFHRRNQFQENENNPELIKMRKEFVKECSMNKLEMQIYINSELLTSNS